MRPQTRDDEPRSLPAGTHEQKRIGSVGSRQDLDHVSDPSAFQQLNLPTHTDIHSRRWPKKKQKKTESNSIAGEHHGKKPRSMTMSYPLP
jgi:hypothetical protein